MRQNLQSLHILTPAVAFPGCQGRDGHQPVAAALFTGLDDMAVEFFEPGVAWMDDAAMGLKRNEAGYAELGELFDQELAAVALGERGGDFEVAGQLALRLHAVDDLEGDLAALNLNN